MTTTLKKDIGRELNFKGVKKVRLITMERGKRYRLLGYSREGYTSHLCEVILK